MNYDAFFYKKGWSGSGKTKKNLSLKLNEKVWGFWTRVTRGVSK